MEWLPAYVTLLENQLKGQELPDEPQGLYKPIRYFLDIGGKRIRPVLTLLGTELFGVDKSKSLSQAVGIELFHNFTLIHDDIMDQAPLRRNQQTVHEKWNVVTAILSGDALMIMAYSKLVETDPEYITAIMSVFNKTALEVCEGQQMDIDFELRRDVHVADYLEMIRLKTSVLLGCALEIGAINAGANQADRKAIYEFGQDIGIAFQIQDDILDLYGNASKTGKQNGGDVIANKKTILYLSAMEIASTEQREVLKQLQSEQDLLLKVDRTKELFDSLEVRKVCEALLQQYLIKAKDALNSIEVPVENKSKLEELAHYLIEREF